MLTGLSFRFAQIRVEVGRGRGWGWVVEGGNGGGAAYNLPPSVHTGVIYTSQVTWLDILLLRHIIVVYINNQLRILEAPALTSYDSEVIKVIAHPWPKRPAQHLALNGLPWREAGSRASRHSTHQRPVVYPKIKRSHWLKVDSWPWRTVSPPSVERPKPPLASTDNTR